MSPGLAISGRTELYELMTSPFTWVETLGGPHVLLPEESLAYWRGIEGWRDHADPTDNSDYARACRIDSWLGVLRCGPGDALVLSGDVGPVAWYQSEDRNSGLLIQWLAADDEEDIILAINGPRLTKVLASTNAECVKFVTGRSGVLRLFDAAEPGDEICLENTRLSVRPGIYFVRAGYLETDNLRIVVRQLCRKG